MPGCPVDRLHRPGRSPLSGVGLRTPFPGSDCHPAHPVRPRARPPLFPLSARNPFRQGADFLFRKVGDLGDGGKVHGQGQHPPGGLSLVVPYAFFPALPLFHGLGVEDLVFDVSFGGHLVFVSSPFFGRKGGDFRGTEPTGTFPPPGMSTLILSRLSNR